LSQWEQWTGWGGGGEGENFNLCDAIACRIKVDTESASAGVRRYPFNAMFLLEFQIRNP